MLENLFQLIKEQGQQEVVDNPAVPNEHNSAVLAEASHAVAGTMQSALANGQAEDVQKLFQGNSSEEIMNSPIAQNMKGNFVESITSKLGINKNVAMSIAASLIPMVLSKLVHRTNSTAPQDNGFNFTELISSLTGGANRGNSGGGINIGNIIDQFTGGSHSTGATNGGFNIRDILSQVTNGAQKQQEQGGLQGMIKSFFN